MRYERKLIAQFSLIGLGVTLIVASLLSYVLQRQLVKDATDALAMMAGEHVTYGLQHALTSDDLRASFSPDTYRRVDETVKRDQLHSGIVRIKIWSLDKKLLYSNYNRNIGAQSKANTELDQALAGETARKLSTLEKPENETERQWGRLLEVYVPLRMAGSDQIQGAIEIYQTTEELDKRIAETKRIVVIGVFTGFGVLFLGLFGVVLGAARRLLARSHENERLAIEVARAYDQTIEGWAKALDLKDHETEGHSRRVTELSVAIARVMGCSTVELVNIRRGALLHDIGKMGVPDAILRKPGPLDSDEWDVMKQHPQFSGHILQQIGYLTAALDIPLYHHEKWDGTGYSQGLRGKEIPLPARIFAVVDVWDALTNDRPYRRAWPVEKARDYICEQAGKQFDPAVVDIFLRLLDKLKIKVTEVVR